MKSLFTLRFDRYLKSDEVPTGARDTLIIFVASPDLDAEIFASMIEEEIEANLVPDELVIIVREPSFDQTRTALTNGSLNQITLDRLGRCDVIIVGYDRLGGESGRDCIIGKVPDEGVTFEDVQRRGITHIFNERRGFVEGTATYHFENPSGRHTERFIRLSNILARGAEISFIAFCCLQYVGPEISMAYLDTPSLYAVVAAINEQRRSFEGASWIVADNFASYAGFDHYNFEIDESSVVLISASSSGALAARLIAEKNVDSEKILHLLYLGSRSSAVPAVCDLSRDEKDNPHGIAKLPSVNEAVDCPMCAGGSHAIKLQGDQFEFAGPQQDALLVGLMDAPKGLSSLMNRYACEGVFEVGHGRGGAKVPRLFHINVEKLLASDEFNRKLEYAMRRSLPASLSHVIVADQQSELLAQRIADSVPERVRVISRENIDGISTDTADAIVVVASVIESGRTLLDISRDLRSVAPNAPLIYLAGMAKTTGEPRRERLENSLIQTHNFFPYQLLTVDHIVIPSSYDNHAWAAELKLLIDPAVSTMVPGVLKDKLGARVARLRMAREPLGNDLFLANADVPLSLQPGFVFWPQKLPAKVGHRQADVYFTISSVLQQLRANAFSPGARGITSNWFQQTVLAPGNFGRFNDDVIQASLLRAAYPFELNFTDSISESRELARLVRRVIDACEAPRGGAATEFLLALATGRLKLRKADVEQVLGVRDPSVPMVKFMLDVCRLRLQ